MNPEKLQDFSKVKNKVREEPKKNLEEMLP